MKNFKFNNCSAVLLLAIIFVTNNLMAYHVDSLEKQSDFLNFGTKSVQVGINGLSYNFNNLNNNINSYLSSGILLNIPIKESFEFRFGGNFNFSMDAFMNEKKYTPIDNYITTFIQLNYLIINNEKNLVKADISYRVIRGFLIGNEINKLTQIDLTFPSKFEFFRIDNDLNRSFNLLINPGIGYSFQYDKVVPMVDIGVSLGSWLKISFDLTSLFTKYDNKMLVSSLQMRN
jgi:hypothetical protein